MAASFELWSFVNKFSQLLDCGVRAEMHVTSNAGKIAINLNAEVESSTFLQQSNNCVRNKLSPSKLRRRQRRKEARIRNLGQSRNLNAQSNDTNVDTMPEDTNIDSSYATTTSEDYVRVLSPAPTMDRATDTINQLLVHSAVQAVCDVRDVACGDEALVTCLSSSVDEQCSFCKVQISSWTEFNQHLRKCSFMCANCLDYFAEKPNFPRSNLVCIDTEDGVQLYHIDRIIDLSPR